MGSPPFSMSALRVKNVRVTVSPCLPNHARQSSPYSPNCIEPSTMQGMITAVVISNLANFGRKFFFTT